MMECKNSDDNLNNDSNSIISKLQAIEDKINGKNITITPLKKPELVTQNRRKSQHICRDDYIDWFTSEEEKSEDEYFKNKKKKERRNSDFEFKCKIDFSNNKNLPKKKRGRPKKLIENKIGDENHSCEKLIQQTDESKIKKGRGRPKKLIKETEQIKTEIKTRGRPKKKNDKQENEDIKGRGRPKKNKKQNGDEENNKEEKMEQIIMNLSDGIFTRNQRKINSEIPPQGVFEFSAETKAEEVLKEAQLSTTALKALGMLDQDEEDSEETGTSMLGTDKHDHFLTSTFNNLTKETGESAALEETEEARRQAEEEMEESDASFMNLVESVFSEEENEDNEGATRRTRSRKPKPRRPPNPDIRKRQFHVIPDTWYTCKKCGTIFKFLSTYEYHLKAGCYSGRGVNAPGPTFKCTECSKVVASRASLMVHMRIHTGERPFKCHFCDTAFFQKAHLNDHLDKLHINPKEIKCNRCPVVLKGYAEWRAHNAQCGEPVPAAKKKMKYELPKVDKTWEGEVFSCYVCFKNFKSDEALREHALSHTLDEKKFKCEECVRMFCTQAELERHSKTHKGESYPCDVCGKEFNHKRRFRDHMRRHNGNMSYHCSSCPKKFCTDYELMLHCRIHTDERPFPCPICKKAFRRKDTMEVHLTIHTGTKRWKCQVCPESFNRNSKLQMHILSAHQGTDRFICCHCNKSFVCKTYLIPHMRIHSGEKPYVCEICGIKYAGNRELKYHLQRNHLDNEKNKYARAFVSVEGANEEFLEEEDALPSRDMNDNKCNEVNGLETVKVDSTPNSVETEEIIIKIEPNDLTHSTSVSEGTGAVKYEPEPLDVDVSR